jgi:hypothetical protein
MNNTLDQAPLFTVALTEQERTELIRWLEAELRNKLVEEHRTDALEYKAHLANQEVLLERLICKLRASQS